MSDRAEFEKFRDCRNAALERHKSGSNWHVNNTHYPTWQAARAQGDGWIKCSETQRNAINHALDVLSKHGDAFTSVGAMSVLEEMLDRRRRVMSDRRSEIDPRFYRGGRKPVATSVLELRELLSELPDDLPVMPMKAVRLLLFIT